mgnify:CR=1 FL=1
MTPFRVEIELLTPVALNAPFIHFDAVIAHLRALRNANRDYYSLPTKKVVVVSKDEDYFMYSRGVFHASAGIFVDAKIDYVHYYKRFDEFFYELVRGKGPSKVNVGSGFYKAFSMKTVYVSCEKVIFYACGLIDKIKDVLQCLTHLGNDTRQGWGRIARIEVFEEAEDYSLFKDDLAMRAIPVKHVSHAEEVAVLPFRPPYWAKENLDVCVVPFTRCTP